MEVNDPDYEAYASGFALGKHMTVEYYDCDTHILCDAKAVEDAFIRAAVSSGATVIGADFHNFKPQGVSGFVVIAESHFSVHAWPEHDYAAVDIFTCGESINFQTAVNSLKESLRAEEMVISSIMNRGVITNNGLEKTIPVFDDRSHSFALSWKAKYEKNNAVGLSANIDVYNCDRETIGNPQTLRRFGSELCVHLGIDNSVAGMVSAMSDPNRQGDLNLVLALDSAMISGHFTAATATAYLDIFCCNYYEPREAAEFAMKFFKGSNYRLQVALRR